MQHNFSRLLLLFTCLLIPFLGKSQGYRYETGVPLLLEQAPSPLAAGMPWSGGLNSVQASLTDTDGDTRPELVIFDRSSTQVQVFAQTAEGWRWLPRERFRFPADVTNWMLLVDYNGDGREDLFTYTPAGIRVFENIAEAGQPASWELAYPLLMYPGKSGSLNLLVNSGDIPLIADTDGDGDIDIAAFDPSGSGTIHWYKNVSVENSGRSDMLAFELADRHWGGITECACKELALNKAPCADAGGREGQRPMHAGGKSLLWRDLNGDAVPDLLMGEEGCTQLYYLANSGTAAAPLFETAASGLPAAETPTDFYFPAAYALDDQVLLSSNLRQAGPYLSQQASLWRYERAAEGGFRLVEKDFLQAQMIDVGEEARPAFADVDADGDLDLLLGTRGSLEADGYYGRVQLYENTATATAPVFQLKDRDFLGLSAAKYQHLQPQLADFNKDGAQDLVLTAIDQATAKVQTRVYLNKAPKGAEFLFESEPSLALPLGLSTLDYPHYYDVSGDGLPDALVGRFDGSLRLYTNTGTVAAPQFSLQEQAYKGFGLQNLRRHLIPTVGDADADGRPDLIASDATGGLRILYGFLDEEAVAADAKDVAVTFDETAFSPRLGDRSWPALAGLWGREQPALVAGQIGGGLVLLRNGKDLPAGGTENFSLDVYPNPSKGLPVNIKTNAPAQVQVYNMLGQRVASWQTSGYESLQWEPRLPAGFYVVEARFAGAKRVKVLILAP